MASMQVAFAPGKCAACGGRIAKGDTFVWGAPGSRDRLHPLCATSAPTAPPPADEDMSAYQRAIVDWVKDGTGNAIVEAVAGSGKTTSLVRVAHAVTVPSKYLVFNRENARSFRELQERDASLSHVDCSTFHAAGFAGLRIKLGRVQVEDDKCKKIFNGMADAREMTASEKDAYFSPVLKLVHLAKCVGIGCLVRDDPTEWDALIDHHDVQIDSPEPEPWEVLREVDSVDRVIQLARRVLDSSNADLNVIDYDDMIYLPVKFGCPLPKFPLVLVDEAQDTSNVRRAIVRMSMDEASRVVFVGDRRQAVYGFTGASNDAMDRIREEFGCTELPLSINYRCAKNIVEAARPYCPQIEAFDEKPDGVVDVLNEWALTSFERGDAVLCRLNAPMIALAYRLIGKGVPARVLGRDIGSGLVSLIKKLQGKGRKVKTLEDLEVRLDAYLNREVAKWTAKGKEAQVQAVQDKVESLYAAMEGMPEDERTIEGLIERLEAMFSDDPNNVGVTLTTVHKSKGLQFRRVFILDPGTMPVKWARKSWMQVQEQNLIYIAITRAEEFLFYVNSDQIKESVTEKPEAPDEALATA